MLRLFAIRGLKNPSSWVDVRAGSQPADIYPCDRANQPMTQLTAVIVYNGEVYNYLEIKQELEERGYKFRTTSRHEVIQPLRGVGF